MNSAVGSLPSSFFLLVVLRRELLFRNQVRRFDSDKQIQDKALDKHIVLPLSCCGPRRRKKFFSGSLMARHHAVNVPGETLITGSIPVLRAVLN